MSLSQNDTNKEVGLQEQDINDYSRIDQQVEDIKELLKKNYPDADVSLVDKAYHVASKAHGSQKRRSGEPYIMHPIGVAYILASYHMDLDTIIAAILHDVIEDTSWTYDDIKDEFNEQIAYMVDIVSKLTRSQFQSKEESNAEYIKRMILSMTNDIRIIIIKLVDRLHNMRTLEYMSSSKQIEKSKETLNIYAPIANMLGIQSIKSELEDLAFKYLEPKAYYEINRKVNQTKGSKKAYIDKVVKLIQKELKESGIEAKVYGRKKHLYSIFKKMKKTGRKFDEIYDLFAIRIITKTVSDCYAALGVIHLTWNIIPGRMKDYITIPKSNGYQSFHTTVVGPNGSPLEVQIRTEEMHKKDEFGVAAHWKYKEGRENSKGKTRKFEEDISGLRQLINWSDDFENASEFLESMKVDILNEEVYVYTPKGEIVELPKGSTPIDFAYKIHTDVGNSCIGAKVNNRIVGLDYQLQLGDICSILTSKSSNGPSTDWLGLAKSAHARNKIRQWFKKQNKEDNINKGKAMLLSEVKKQGNNLEDLLKPKNIEKVAEAFKLPEPEDLYLSIGVDSVSPVTVFRKMEELFPEYFPKEEEELIPIGPENVKEQDSYVLISGQRGIETHLANCCSPIPGDKIVGYTTHNNKGITIHRTDCSNIANLDQDSGIIEAQWDYIPKTERFKTEVFIEAASKEGGLLDVVQPFYDLKTKIVKTNTRTANNIDYYNIACLVRNKRDLSLLLKQISKIPEVFKVERA